MVPDRDEILDSRVVVPENVVLRAFEAQTLLLNLDTGTYHGLNDTALYPWRASVAMLSTMRGVSSLL